MAKRRSISVSWHAASRQYVKWVGNSRGADGRLRPKCHYLGDNQSDAVARAVALLAEWKTLKADGKDAWPSQVQGPAATVPGVPRAAAPAEAPQPATVPAAPKLSLTVEEASKAYLAVIRAERDAKQVTPQHYESMRYKLARIVTGRCGMSDCGRRWPADGRAGAST